MDCTSAMSVVEVASPILDHRGHHNVVHSRKPSSPRMSEIKHRPTLSAPPSYIQPPPVKRKPVWQKLASGQLRIVSILLLGTSIFLALHTAFGQLNKPRFQHLDAFPKKVWQSWKVDPLRFEDRDIKRARSWTGLNPAHRYEVLTDANALPWVELNFGPQGFNRPDIINTYKSLENNLKIIQADLLRYLIMYAEGGVWTDIDVQAIKPLDSFIPKGFDESNIQMIIGIETDEPDFKDHPVLGSKAQSFCQWTFVCKPRLPVMLKLIDNIQIWLARLANEQGKPISELHLGFDEVLSGTGPSAFTQAILKQMSKDTHRTVTWDKFHDMTDSLVVGGVLVLPAEAFAAGTGHSKSGNHGSRRALVKHHFHASSWTTRHPRHKHPIYGEVERCNWDMECVKLWDANTAFYASLPERDQQRMIGIKRLHEAQSEQPAPIGKPKELGAPMGGQVPMGEAPVEPPKPDGPPDLAAIARFLGQQIEESSKDEPLEKSGDAPLEPPKPDGPPDLAAIARFLGQKVEEPAPATPEDKPIGPELKPEEEKKDPPGDLASIAEASTPKTGEAAAITEEETTAADEKPEAEEKKEAPIDLAAIARYLGQAIEDAPAASLEEKLVTAPVPADEDHKDLPIDLTALGAALAKESEIIEPHVQTEEEAATPKAEVAEDEPALDLASIAAWMKGSQPENSEPKLDALPTHDSVLDEDDYEDDFDEEWALEDDDDPSYDEVDPEDMEDEGPDIDWDEEDEEPAPRSTARTAKKGLGFSRLWSK